MTGGERRALGRVVQLAPPDRRMSIVALLCATAAVLGATALLAVSGALISKAALRPPVLSLGVLIVVVRALALTRSLSRYGERLAAHDVAFRALARLRASFFQRLATQRPAVGGTRQSELLSRFVADVDRLQDLYLRALAPPAVAAVSAVVICAAVAVILPVAALVLACGLAIAGLLVPWATARIAQSASQRQAQARAALSAEVLDAARHGAELAVLGQAQARVDAISAADRQLARLARRDALAAAAAAAGTALAQGAVIVGMLLVAVPATVDGRIDGILLAALVLLTFGAFEAVATLPAAAVALDTCASAADRIVAVTDAPDAVVDPPNPVACPRATDIDVRGADVGFAGAPVLGGLDLHVDAGELVAIVGPSGAGKSTLAELLVRFRDPDAGEVRLGGIDVRHLALHDLRGAVRLIAADPGIFTTTLVENVRLARPDADDDAVRAALDAVGLGAWIDELPDGVHTLIAEDGESVSGGQRRRIALARALIADAAVLVVDEPTAHLDPDAAQAALDVLCAHARARGQSLIAIVHPGCDLAGFDRVLELRAGRLADA